MKWERNGPGPQQQAHPHCLCGNMCGVAHVKATFRSLAPLYDGGQAALLHVNMTALHCFPPKQLCLAGQQHATISSPAMSE